MARSQRVIAVALAERDTSRILSVVFDRLYVLRNQLVHGGATWNSGVNRNQVRDGATVMGFLAMRMWPISTRVNKPENDDPSILNEIVPGVEAAE